MPLPRRNTTVQDPYVCGAHVFNVMYTGVSRLAVQYISTNWKFGLHDSISSIPILQANIP